MSKHSPTPLERAAQAFKCGKYAQAIGLFTQIIESSGPTLQTLDSRAAASTKLGKLQNALKDAKRAIELAPNSSAGYARAARVLKDQSRLDAALAMTNHALQRRDKNRRAELDKLKAEIVALQDESARLRKANACHIAVLPVEILSEIFSYGLEEDPDAPLRLGAVCRHWRDAIHASPALWVRLRLGDYKPQAKAQRWFDLSRTRVRDVVVRGRLASVAYNDLRAAGHLTGIRTLDLVLPRDSRAAESPNLDDLPALKGFKLTTSLNVAFGEQHMQSLSRLHHLSADVEHLGFNSIPIMAELSSLHIVAIQVHFESVDWHTTVGELLQASPLLQSLLWRNANSINPARTPLGPISLPLLTSLDLEGPLTVSTVLDALQVPRLERLVLRPFRRTSATLRRLRSSDLVNLQELRLTAVNDHPKDLLPILLGMLRLTTLQLSNSSIDMSAIIDGISALPLEEVDFTHCSKLAGGPLVRLVKARMPDGEQTSRIRVMIVDGCPLVEPDVLPWLRSTVARFSSVYMTKKAASGSRFLG